MNRNLVNEKIAFNRKGEHIPFYMDCLHRKIHKKGPPSIYHYHDKIELLYCIKGELEIVLFSESIVLKEGDFICISKNTPHATMSFSDYNEHICIKFDNTILHVPSSKKIPSEEYYLSLLDTYELFCPTKDNHEYIQKLFTSCIENFSHDDYYKRLTLRATIMLIMSFIFKNSTNPKIQKPTTKIANNFSKVFEYIDSNYATITLEAAAEFCSMSYSYFSRTFKAETGISFSNYVIKKKVEKSLELLSNDDMSLNTIALECGFSNLSHYIKCFSEEKGITPKKFRSMASKN